MSELRHDRTDQSLDAIAGEIGGLRMAPSTDFAADLDRKVESGFSGTGKSASLSKIGEDRWRRILAPVMAGLATILIVVAISLDAFDGLRSVEPEMESVATSATELHEESLESEVPISEFFSEDEAADTSARPKKSDDAGTVPATDETTASAEPLDESIADPGRSDDAVWLPIGLIAAGLLLLLPALWISSHRLRRRWRERPLDW